MFDIILVIMTFSKHLTIICLFVFPGYGSDIPCGDGRLRNKSNRSASAGHGGDA